MRVFFKFFSLTLMCAFTTGIVDAHTLHIGNKSFTLSQTKYTTPSLAFSIGSETWYGALVTQNLTDTLHVQYNNKTYSLCEPFIDTVNYTYDNDGRLIGADENLWIQQELISCLGPTTLPCAKIDTNFIARGNTRIKTKFYNVTNMAKWFFGVRGQSTNDAFALQCAGPTAKVRNDYGTYIRQINNAACGTIGIFVVDKNKNVTTLQHPNGNTYTGNGADSVLNFSTPYSMPIMAMHSTAATQYNSNKFYYFKIWDNDVLVRDMVPVPACMRIGDFIVPENGMWDIVEQKFYGNANTTGTIIYGKDE